MRCHLFTTRSVVLVLAALSVGFSISTADHNPGHGGGRGEGGGGGGGGGPSYLIISLDNADGSLASGAEDINNTGLIVGSVQDPITEESRAACWTLDSSSAAVTSTLHLLDGGSAAFGVNDANEIVGELHGTAVYWRDPGATAIVLPQSPVFNALSRAIAINENGVVCGWAREPDGLQVAVVWRVNINSTDDAVTMYGPVILPQFSPDHHYAAAITDNVDGDALVAGGAFGGDASLARYWIVRSDSDGSLGVIDGPTTLDVGNAPGVNGAALVCGHTQGEAAVWDVLSGERQILDRSASIRIAGGRKTFSTAQANAINSNGAIAGYATASLHPAAVIWPTPTARIVVLDGFLKNTSIAELNFARAINDFGCVVGSGWDSDRELGVGFLAIPN